MAEQIPENVEANIDASVGEEPKKRRRGSRQPTYKVVGSSRIPVSKATGSVWKSRVAQVNQHTQEVRIAWSEAIRYFGNDQLPHRDGKPGVSGNRRGNQKLNDNITETENIVFSNVTTMVPALYSRNPKAEFTTQIEELKSLATTVERLVNTIGGRKAAPGINLKPKAKRCVVTTLLTNRSWIKIGWTTKQDSSEQALNDLAKLAKQLVKAKTSKEIVEIEGKIEALEQSIDILQPSGPFAKVKSPFDVFVDPNAKEIDLSDAKWVIETDMIPTEFILAKYAKKKGKTNEYRSIYKSTHVMKASLEGDDGIADDGNNFSPFAEGKDETAKSFGFTDEESFNKAKMTKVYIVWDKVTRRVLMFNSKDWTWPIWVWDDPLQLDAFFPYYPLTFYESPDGPLTQGEVSYYLDQQDGINEITDEKRRARRWARRNIFYNKSLMSQKDASAVLNGDDGTARGLDVPPDTDLNKLIASIAPPSMQHKDIFDKEELYRAVDRISSVGTVMRGEQFKTNTNKAAVQANASAANMRVDEKSDSIEDWMGQVYWGIAQLCLMNMSKEDVETLIGPTEEWKNMSPTEIRQLSMTVVGGSTKKPTSAMKKEEALEMGQVLGQFVNAAPGPVLKIMLQVFQEAFDEVTITEEDWDELLSVIDQQNQPEQGQEAASPDVSSASPEELQQLLAKLPPEVKQQVQSAIDSGVPPQQALQSVLEQSQGQQPTTTQ